MPSTNLTVLLDLRRAAQDDAKRVLGEAVTNLARTEAEQGRLEALLAQAEQALASGSRGFPADAAEGLARERFRQRQLARREQARCQASEHRKGPLVQARLAEAAATETLRQASLELMAAQRLHERQQAERRKQAERREEQQTEDWVQSSHHHRKPR